MVNVLVARKESHKSEVMNDTSSPVREGPTEASKINRTSEQEHKKETAPIRQVKKGQRQRQENEECDNAPQRKAREVSGEKDGLGRLALHNNTDLTTEV